MMAMDGGGPGHTLTQKLGHKNISLIYYKQFKKSKNVQKIGSWPKNTGVGRVIMWVVQGNYISKISSHHSTHESAIKIQEKYSPELVKID